MAASILDINDVYLAFSEQVQKLFDVAEETGDPKAIENLDRYRKYCETLKSVMMGNAALREHLIMFVGEIWNLDEESIKVYMG